MIKKFLPIVKNQIGAIFLVALTFMGCTKIPLYDLQRSADKIAFMTHFLDPGGNETDVSIQYFAEQPSGKMGDPTRISHKLTDEVYKELKKQMNGEALYRTTAKEEFLTEKKMLGEVSKVYEYEDSDIDLVVNCNNFIKYTEDGRGKFTLNIDTQLMVYKYPKNAGSVLGYSIISFEEPLGEFENKDLEFFLENYPYEEYIDEALQLVPEGVSNFVARIKEKAE